MRSIFAPALINGGFLARLRFGYIFWPLKSLIFNCSSVLALYEQANAESQFVDQI
jgi:hypothetical protein